MLNIFKKKINVLILVIFLYLSLSNISEFGNYTQKISSSDEQFNITYFDEKSVIVDEELNELLENSQRNELVKKESINRNDGENLDFAEYSNQSVTSDVIIDENDINLSLVPVYATMLFSGIPVPESKPIPEEAQYEKSVILSVKNKKSLNENLKKFLDKKEAEETFKQISQKIDYKTKENLKFFLDSDDNVIEISSFVDGMRQLNLRRNFNDDFVYYYVYITVLCYIIKL